MTYLTMKRKLKKVKIIIQIM